MDKRNKTITLERHSDGYRLAQEQTANWKGYKGDTSGFFLAHDFYMHQIDGNEHGLMWEELRAAGAALYFEPIGDKRRLMPKEACVVMERYIKSEGRCILPLPVHELPIDAVEHYTKVVSAEWLDLFLSVLNIGYQYAMTTAFPKESYFKIKEMDFDNYFNDNVQKLQIHLWTGEVSVMPS